AITGSGVDAITGSGVDAITGSGVDAITGSGVDAITGSGVDAITGSGVDAITGSGVDAITGSGVDAITGRGVDAITGRGVDAITGSGVDAITGSGVDAITGSGVDAITGSGVDAITGSGVDAITGSGSPMLAGPIDSLNLDEGTFMAVGQTISFAVDGIADMQVGDYVTVHGELAGAGYVDATAVDVSPSMYVPGVSEVFVTGIPSSVDFTLGTVQIGQLAVDYTSSLGGDTFGGVGAAVTVIGTQPALGGTMLGDRVIDRTELFLRD
ncbi:MAG: hypothetical protein KJO09_15085, partial [Gammaproteobacteria bacterium]|nr:hypothetical protein [Gammaproteobacteria bacterium]